MEEQNRTARRSARENRELLEAAAMQLFRQQGYDNTTTRDIAESAAVAERQIFRHYGGKYELFSSALTGALREALDGFASRWSRLGRDRYDLAEIMTAYVRELFVVANEFRRPLIDLIALRERSGPPAVASSLDDLSEGLRNLAAQEAARQGWSTESVYQSMHLLTLLVISSTLFAEHLSSEQSPVPADSFLAGLTHVALYGALNLPRIL